MHKTHVLETLLHTRRWQIYAIGGLVGVGFLAWLISKIPQECAPRGGAEQPTVFVRAFDTLCKVHTL